MAKKINIIANLVTSQFKKQVKELETSNYKVDIDVDSEQIGTANKNMKRLESTTASTNSVFSKLKNTIADTFSSGKIAMTAYLAVLREINRAGTEAKQTILDIDSAITDLSVAGDQSRESATEMVKGYNSYAKKLKSTTGDITSAADDYLRAGKSLQESQALIKDSIILSKLGQIDSGEASTDLLATINGYEMSIGEVDKALDAMVAIDMKAATSAGDLATGLKYSASSANSAGLSFNKLVAILGTVQDKTQLSAETVGTFANTILSRYRDVTLGKYLTDDGEDISNYESVLKSIGIELRDSQGEFRAFEDVLGEMANSWNTLTSVQQNALIKVAAGTRQQNRWIALMEGYNKVLELTEVAANSAGTAVEKYNKSYMGSLEAQQNTLQASFESMIMNSDLDEVYGDIIEVTTALVDFINQTNALKGAMTALTVSGGIKGFLAIRTGINQAYIELNKFNQALHITKQADIPTQDFDRLLLLSQGLSTNQTKLVISTKNLSLAQKEQLLVSQGLTKEEAGLQLQTWGMATAQNGLTVSTISLRGAMSGLWNVIKASPVAVLTTAISLASMVYSSYQQKIEETRQATLESANSYKESAKSIDEYVSKYQDLHKALQNARGDEQETYNVKKQLLDLQNELNEKYGDEYGRLNLVASGYQDLTDSIKAYSKEASQTFLNENYTGIKDAEKQMTKERHYNLSGTGVSQYTEEGSILRKVAVEYEEQGVSVLDNEDGTFSVHITADAESASATIDSFMDDLREKAQELGKEHLFDDVLQVSSEGLNRAKETIDSYGEIYRQALMAEIVVDASKANTYNRVLSAVDSYNNAITISSDPYNDQNVEKARQELESVRQEIQNNEAEWAKYSLLLNDVFNQADTHLLDFNAKLQNDKGLQKLTSDLQGLQDVDLQSLNPGENNSFDKLKESADEAGVSVDELIGLLVQAGAVQGEIISQTENTPGITFDSSKLEELNDQIDSIQSAYNGLLTAAEEYSKHGYITADTLQTLLALDGEYLACLINENGQLRLNGTAYQELVQAKLADARSTAVQQAIQELSTVTTEQQIQADVTSIGIMAEKQSALIGLSEKYSALAGCAISAAEAQALADGYLEASNVNQEEADRIMSNLNAKLVLIDSTAISTAGSFGALTNHLNGFTSATGNATDAADEFTKSLQKQKDVLEDEKDALTDKKEYYEKVADAVNWYLGEQIEQQNKIIEGIEKENDLLEERLNGYDDALSAVDRFYAKEQEALRAQIDAMSDANTEKEKSLALEKAQYALQQAQNNKTKLVYSHNKGFSFQADQNAISEARDNLANATEDMTKYQIEQEIQKIQELRDAWAEIPNIKKWAEQQSMAAQILGANWEAQLMSGRLDAITAFKDSYLGIQKEIDNNESLIASYEEKVQYYQQLQEQWQTMLDRYTEYENTQLLIMEFGNNYAEELLKGRTEKWDAFADNYFNVQMRLKDVTEQIASITKQMEDYAARMESAANRAVIAAQKAASASISSSGNSGTSGNLPRFRNDPIGAYASGTDKTKKGLALVAEEGAEIITDGDSARVVTTPTLVNMRGGETVYNADETQDILDKKDPWDFMKEAKGEHHMVTTTENGVKQLISPEGKVFTRVENPISLFGGKNWNPLGINKRGIANESFVRQQESMWQSMKNSMNCVTQNNDNHKETTNVNFGDIHLQGVQDVNSFARAIKEQLPNAMMRELKRR